MFLRSARGFAPLNGCRWAVFAAGPVGCDIVGCDPTNDPMKGKKKPRNLAIPGFLEIVELAGFEPATLCLQSRCATSCAIAPFDLFGKKRAAPRPLDFSCGPGRT